MLIHIHLENFRRSVYKSEEVEKKNEQIKIVTPSVCNAGSKTRKGNKCACTRKKKCGNAFRLWNIHHAQIFFSLSRLLSSSLAPFSSSFLVFLRKLCLFYGQDLMATRGRLAIKVFILVCTISTHIWHSSKQNIIEHQILECDFVATCLTICCWSVIPQSKRFEQLNVR